MILGLILLMTGCVRDTLEGDWEGTLTCNSQEYEVIARFIEGQNFEYTGQMQFVYERDVTYSGKNGVFHAELLYEFTTVMTETSGGQDIYLDMTWDKVNCSTEFDDGTEQDGGCQNVGGMDTSTKGDKIGYVEMRYSGSDLLSIDDDNCKGQLEHNL